MDSNRFVARSRWKEEQKYANDPKLYNEKNDTPGNSSVKQVQLLKSEHGAPRGIPSDKTTSNNSPQNLKYNKSNSRYNKIEMIDICSKSSQINQNLPEDLRISKLLRRLSSESSTIGIIDLSEKLKVVVLDSANAGYIRRSFDILADGMISVMENCPQDVLPHVTSVFGMMGYVIRHDFQIYKSWICKTYKNCKGLRVAMMNSLEKTLKMDKQTMDLGEQQSRLMELLRDFLEASDIPDTFIAITNVIIVIAANYKKHFRAHFTNIVDIVVGWHLETDQKKNIKNHCSIVLQHLRTFWEADVKFTLDLLGQLLEDIDACHHKSLKLEDTRKEFGSFIGVFNTILKCICATPDTLVYILGKKLVEESYEKILGVSLSALAVSCDEEVTMTVNEFMLLILECRKCEINVHMEEILSIIELQMKDLETFSDHQLSSFFSLVVKFIEEFKSNLPLSFIDSIFEPESHLVNAIRYHRNPIVQNGLIKTYHDVLAIKNVPVLQAAYKNIFADTGFCLKMIPELSTIGWSDGESKRQLNSLQAQFSINFIMIVLSKLATTQNSIIAMWSLTPSILELLSLRLEIWNNVMWKNFELIQFGILKLLVAHCQKSNNFVSSSMLFISKASTNSWSSESSASESPVSQHFKMILDFIDRMLKEDLTTKQVEVMLDWCNKVIQQTAQYSELLKGNSTFNQIIRRINVLSTKYNDEITLKCANCNDSLHAFDQLHPEVFTSIAEICSVQICSVNAEIRSRYSFILSRLPLKYTLEQSFTLTGINQEVANKVSEIENWHLSSGSQYGGDIRAQYFQEFFKKISYSSEETNIDEFIQNAFANCWYNGDKKAEEFKDVTTKDIRTLTTWIQWEAARFCVNNKLKTPLGKPQDTFIKIEHIIKEHARVLALKDKSKLGNYKSVMANQRSVRILLGFMEALEKAIYNASDGNAFGIPAPEKPARTFFRLNASTCNEWFSRNRMAINLLALHCMELEMVIRCSESVLKDLIAAGKTNDPYFDQTLMSLTWALLRNFESDALSGLYVWSKNITGKKYLWIKLAAEQAAGRREIASDGYKKILIDEKFDSKIYDFINDQLKVCLLFSGNYEDLYTHVQNEETIDYQAQNIPILTVTAKQMATYVKFDKTKDPGCLEDLSSWEMLEKGPEVSNNFSVHKLMSLTENTLTSLIIGRGFPSDITAKMCFDVLHGLLQECMRTQSREYSNCLELLNHISHKVVDHSQQNGCRNIESFHVHKKYGSLTMLFVAAYSEFFDDYSPEGEQQNIDLRLDLISSARKEMNYKQCLIELQRNYKKVEYAEHVGFPLELESLNSIKDYLMSSKSLSESKIWSENVTRTVYEHSKCLYVVQNKHQEAIQFAASTIVGIHNRFKAEDVLVSETLKTQCVKFHLKLAEWIQLETDELLGDNAPPALKLLINSIPNEGIVNEKMPLIDAAVGKLIKCGVEKCPNMPKAWSALGNWSYRWGRKMVELKTDSQGFRPIDTKAIRDLIPEGSAEDVEKIVHILNEKHVAMEDDDLGPTEGSSTEQIEMQLRMIPVLAYKNIKCMESIIELWKQAHREVYGYYEMCAAAYFKYLLLSSTNTEESCKTSVVTATLRLLRLIVKHALGLQEVLDEGLAQTPSDPWKVIIPQLFSRLNHHEPYVKRRVSELLCRVAKDSPHLIIFPTVVGAAQEQKIDLEKLTQNDESLESQDSKNTSLTFCFNTLLETLSKQSPKTVSQVQLLVYELHRITLLWDEQWLQSIHQVYADKFKRFHSFESEFQKTDKSPEKVVLFTEKYRLLMRPVLFVLERLHEWTSRTAETNNEKSFQERFSKAIEFTIAEMRKPFDTENPLNAWQKFKSLYQIIQQRVQKRISFTLKMDDISPVLANLKNTLISMPGVQPTINNEAVYIQSVDNVVQILPTKTKPKKLAFYGSDGRRYTYLFKGLEDLHLDERIMQFLSIANLMMKKSVDSDGKTMQYRAHHYSVIPLGPRSGLISWVDGVTPIFSLYKKWQQREAANPKKDKQYVVMRPSELYYNKLTPLLKEHGLKPTDNRKDWPLAVKRQVIEELQAETPRDLLAKEFWCHSTTSSKWRQIVRNYSISLAVMSVIGYIIGLGDRHLDNILVKLASGEVVHIDYNVCFEKGKTLRVPEKVPFRMTPNLEEALGITGIEGTFRLACEHVLKSLKRGRETLLTLLEAFVYDPLVDWAIGEDSTTGGLTTLGGNAGDSMNTDKGSSNINSPSDLTAARKQLEREITRDTLAIRFTEIKSDWTQNRDDVDYQLLVMKLLLVDLTKNRKKMQRSENQRTLLSKQIAMVRELEALGSAMSSHPLNTLSQRYLLFKKKKDDVTMIGNILLEKASESERMIEDYLNCVGDVSNDKISGILIGLKISSSRNFTISEFDLIKDFLESSNQGQIYQQCDLLRKELDSLALQQLQIVENAFEALIQYQHIICYYPYGHHDSHRLSKYSHWCRKLTEDKSTKLAREVGVNFQQLFSEQPLTKQPQEIFNFSFQTKKQLVDLNVQLRGNYQKLQKVQELNNREKSNEIIKVELREYFNSQKTSNGGELIVNEIIRLNKTLLIVEQMAQKSGNKLIDLKLHDRWYVEELRILMSSIVEVFDVVFESNTSKNQLFKKSLESFKSIAGVYENIDSINYKFQNELVPKTLSSIIAQDKSVLEMISSLSSIQNGLLPLSEMMVKLEEEHCEKLMNPGFIGTSIAVDLNMRLHQLADGYKTMKEESMGKKIFLEFHQMFEDLDKNSRTIIQQTNQIVLSQECNNIKEIQQSMNLFTHPTSQGLLSTFEQMFVVKRLEAMIEFFSLCLQVAWAFNGSGVAFDTNLDVISRPVKVYITDFIAKYLLGRGSFCLSVLACCLIEPNNIESLDQLCIVSSPTQKICEKFIKAMEERSRKVENEKYLEKVVHQQTEGVNNLQLMLICHHWLHEEYFVDASMLPPIPRTSMLLQLQSYIQALSSWSSSIRKIREELKLSNVIVLQRLKWGAGANPLLNELLVNFEGIVNGKQEALDQECLYASMALKHCLAVLNYEILRYKTPESIANDQEFLNFLSQWENVCKAEKTYGPTVTQTEEALVELLDPEGPIEHVWINNVTSLIDDMIDQIHNEIDGHEKKMVLLQDHLHSCAHKLRALMGLHHRMVSDIRILLKSILKYEDNEGNQAIKDYFLKYKSFMEVVSELHGNVLSKDLTDGIVQQTIEQIVNVLDVVKDIYNDLFNFEKSIHAESDGIMKKMIRNFSTDGLGSPTKKAPNHKEQKRNAYAVSVWRRIRMKLEGRDPDPNKSYRVQEQVDWMIREALNPENLATLYEGFTAWV